MDTAIHVHDQVIHIIQDHDHIIRDIDHHHDDLDSSGVDGGDGIIIDGYHIDHDQDPVMAVVVHTTGALVVELNS